MLYWVKEDTLFCPYFCVFLFSSNVKMFYKWLILYILFFFSGMILLGGTQSMGEKNSYYQIAAVSVSFSVSAF